MGSFTSSSRNNCLMMTFSEHFVVKSKIDGILNLELECTRGKRKIEEL